ncbi:MAG: fatty acid--CoA ligase family protein, partial [Actinomycetota bacterium]|nr:fatty acid--CoA ligase family protein [Actinomycetota bacterium]
MEMKLVDDAGIEVATGEPGELLVRGYGVMRGYLDDPEQTAETIDADGWMRTGDICVMNEDGYIDITDRKKDMFINGGFNAYPAEIERIMLEHPRIGQVAVIGIPDERLGEVGAAFVVSTPLGPPDSVEVIDWCREQMANYKVPRHCWIVDELPLNPSNKVLKTELRDRAAELLG